MSDQKDTRLPRRRVLQQAAAATAGFTIVPRHVLARSGQTPPSDRFNVAGIGIGGMGRSNMLALASQNIVALCDVDWNYTGEAWSEQRFDDQIAQLEARLKEPPQQATDAQFGRLSAEQVRARAQQQLEDLKRVRE